MYKSNTSRMQPSLVWVNKGIEVARRSEGLSLDQVSAYSYACIIAFCNLASNVLHILQTEQARLR